MSYRKLFLASCAAFALVACGGHKETTSSSTTTSNGIMTNASANPSPSTGVNGPMGGIESSGEPMAPGTLATVPPGLNCGAVRAVWVNTKTHVYHEPSDPYYGRTKHGEYMCPAQAKQQGYHAAGGGHMKGRHHGASSAATPSGDATDGG